MKILAACVIAMGVWMGGCVTSHPMLWPVPEAELLDGGFDAPGAISVGERVTDAPWVGEGVRVCGAEGGLSPVYGDRMLAFAPGTSTDGASKSSGAGEPRRYAVQYITLTPLQAETADTSFLFLPVVGASIASSAGRSPEGVVRVEAFYLDAPYSGDPGGGLELAAILRSPTADVPGSFGLEPRDGWFKYMMCLTIPPGTRVVAVRVAVEATTLRPDETIYVDEVWMNIPAGPMFSSLPRKDAERTVTPRTSDE